MSDTVITVENLSKRYLIGHQSAQSERYTVLRDVLTREARNFLRKAADLAAGRQIVQGDSVEEIWALKDVSFDIKQGEVIGIIGRNGAGKSTLLKILSRITEPTSGQVRLRGRVGSLLEVGTGFHPELTGRENIFLNGAILGMSKREIRKRFDEIVTFAEVDRFLDTPVKRYSTGMYIRLAFSIAAHLEPDIMIVDEVLAVGDAEFQKRCLGKMNDIAKQDGRTILFVSHNLAAVAGLCGSVLWLENGMTNCIGSAAAVVTKYLRATSNRDGGPRQKRRNTGDIVQVTDVKLIVDCAASSIVQAGQSCTFVVRYKILDDRPVESLSCSIMLFCDGQKLTNLWTNSQRSITDTMSRPPKEGAILCHIPKWPFRNMNMRADVYTHVGHAPQDWIEEALLFDSHDGDYYNSGVVPDQNQGFLFLDHKWEVSSAS